ncbi:MAG: homocysteine S-methyltransferase family protein, partial [Candidatus Hydrogenedentota bacterium]
MGTQIQALGVTDADFGGKDFRMLSDLLCFSKPGHVKQIHMNFYRAGANAVETNTFGASPMRFSEYDFKTLDLTNFEDNPYGDDIRELPYEEMARSLSRRAGEIACEAREEVRQDADFDGRPLFVIGSIGPSNRVLSRTEADLTVSTFDAIMDNFYHEVMGLLEGNVDVLLYETQQDVLELKAAVMGGQKAMKDFGKKIPIMAQVTVDQFCKMQIFNTDIHAALTTMQDIGIDVFGINCSIGPDLMVDSVDKLSRYSKLPISVIPNAGLPQSEDGVTVFKLPPEELARYLADFVDTYGVNIVGGCCGTTPDHIAAVAEAVKGKTPKERKPPEQVFVSGPQNAVALDSSENNFIMIGERLNLRGSKKARDAVENADEIDHEALEDIIREQVQELGLRLVDVCMDSNVVDTTATLKEVVHRQTTDFAGAMALDSFAIDALLEAIQVYPGRPIINSISLEESSPGVVKLDELVEATKNHAPVYIGLCTGPEGPGSTADEKYELAKRIVERAAEHGVTPDQLLIDINIFPIGAESSEDMNFAMESLNAIEKVKTIHPDLKTCVGMGNLTNGLGQKPYMRKVLTSVFLEEARKKGLDGAIINPHHFVAVSELDKGDYELGLKVVLERDMDAFAELEDIAERKKGKTVVRRTSYEDLSLEESICQKIKDGFKQREKGSVEFKGETYEYEDKIVVEAAQALETHEPLDFINDYLMAAMQELGDGFARGEFSLPHLLKSADVMKQVMGFIERYMRIKTGSDVHDEINYKGTIVLGTVYQDVHSIGKDLAKTLWENYGYRVIDLGVMTPLEDYLENARKYEADAIGMSALLVQTSNHMITVSKMMEEQGLAHLPVLIGGAPVNDRHAAYVALAGKEDNAEMRGNVFYCPTAMDGVNVMNKLVSSDAAKGELIEGNLEKLQKQFDKAKKRAKEDEERLATLPRREISFDKAPKLDSPWTPFEKVNVPLKEFASSLDKKTLFALNWKFGGKKAREKRGETQEVLEALLEKWVRQADEHGWVQPQGVCALYPCQADGDEIVLYDPENLEQEVTRIDFTPVIGAGRKDVVCGAQYFRPKGSGEYDVVGLQLSTSGAQVDEYISAFREEGDSESTLYLQGLSDRVAEDMADYLHEHLRELLGLGGTDHGTRWSPGYPGMANPENNKVLFELLRAGEELGVQLTDACEFYPTGTTAAVVSFHPEAR